MATAITPKSVFRQNDNITVGYGDVPAIYIDGVLAWGLPGGQITFREKEAIAYATKLDQTIRANLKDVNQLASAN
jgi:hypothetical protein